jgi:hypothetical protein
VSKTNYFSRHFLNLLIKNHSEYLLGITLIHFCEISDL